MPARAFPSSATETPACSADSLNFHPPSLTNKKFGSESFATKTSGNPLPSRSEITTPSPLLRYFPMPVDSLTSVNTPWPSFLNTRFDMGGKARGWQYARRLARSSPQNGSGRERSTYRVTNRSRSPSPSRSANAQLVLQPPPATPADAVTSVKVKSPRFLYSALPPAPVTYRSM